MFEETLTKTRELLLRRKYFNARIFEEMGAYGGYREKGHVLGLAEIETVLDKMGQGEANPTVNVDPGSKAEAFAEMS